jgi:nucleotide-binding universal stress UspA family protein
MFKKIAWASDGSESADRALAVAKSLASEQGSALVAIHSVELLAGPGSRGAFTADAEEGDHRSKIERQVNELVDGGVNASMQVVEGGLTGTAAHTIAEVAENEGADLIVVGSRGHTAFAGLLLGGVAQRILHIARCPVLVVPPP